MNISTDHIAYMHICLFILYVLIVKPILAAYAYSTSGWYAFWCKSITLCKDLNDLIMEIFVFMSKRYFFNVSTLNDIHFFRHTIHKNKIAHFISSVLVSHHTEYKFYSPNGYLKLIQIGYVHTNDQWYKWWNKWTLYMRSLALLEAWYCRVL